MARNVPKCPLDLLLGAKQEKERQKKWFSTREVVEKTYQISVVTPMFGGGVRAGILDDVTPVRGTSVRGHLRFWWRALYGASFDSLKDMREREGMLWGTTEKASPVEIALNVSRAGVSRPCADAGRGSFPRFQPAHKGYVLFPFQGNSRENIPVGHGRHGLAFTLSLRSPSSFFKEVEAALRAWVLFGGIGARTRRGCGSLYCKELSPSSLNALENIAAYFAEAGVVVGRRNGRDISSLPRHLHVGDRVADPENVWMNVVGSLKNFRQGENVGRNPGRENRPGRSRWPEPESIRCFTRRREAQHQRMADIPDNAFPRALFGLPIIFHFKDRNDPQDTELSCHRGRERKNRMASPLIIKPLALAEDRAVSMVMVLDAPEPENLGLFSQGNDLLAGARNILIQDPALERYRNSPMRRYSPEGNALEAFVTFANAQGVARRIDLA